MSLCERCYHSRSAVVSVTQLGAMARATDTITCKGEVPPLNQLANASRSLIELAFESGNVETVYQLIVATSVALSTLNCSQMCASLNRQACIVAARAVTAYQDSRVLGARRTTLARIVGSSTGDCQQHRRS